MREGRAHLLHAGADVAEHDALHARVLEHLSLRPVAHGTVFEVEQQTGQITGHTRQGTPPPKKKQKTCANNHTYISVEL